MCLHKVEVQAGAILIVLCQEARGLLPCSVVVHCIQWPTPNGHPVWAEILRQYKEVDGLLQSRPINQVLVSQKNIPLLPLHAVLQKHIAS